MNIKLHMPIKNLSTSRTLSSNWNIIGWLGLALISCFGEEDPVKSGQIKKPKKPKPVEQPVEYPVAHSFDYPVGKPDAKGYYNAQGFGENAHLGDDWNALTGGNSDLGDPIFSIAHGLVKMAENLGGGWGNVIIVEHTLPNKKRVESLYAHCDEILVKKDQIVQKGDTIATIGTANGAYLAHLHFEIRDQTNMGVGPGYSDNTKGYLNPTEFIESHRRVEDTATLIK